MTLIFKLQPNGRSVNLKGSVMKRNTKEAIICQAAYLIKNRGYEAVSMMDIAQSVGIGKSSLYSHFSGKNDLVHQVLQYKLNQILANIPSSHHSDESYISAIQQIADFLVTEHKCIGFQLLYSADEQQKQELAVHDFFSKIQSTLTSILCKKYAGEQCTILIEDSLTMLEGATLWLILNNDAAPMERIVSQITNQLKEMNHDPISDAALNILTQMFGHRIFTISEVKLANQLAKTETDFAKMRSLIDSESCFN